MRETTLVIGYGNDLRGDDGLGPAVAEAVAALGLPGVESRRVQQLVPELAEELARARLAVFIDARVGSGGEAVQVVAVEPAETADRLAHTADPAALLALTRAVHGRTPQAWLVTVAGAAFDFGEGLSAVARENARRARDRIATLLG
jgi:hydrogenase maturation protease